MKVFLNVTESHAIVLCKVFRYSPKYSVDQHISICELGLKARTSITQRSSCVVFPVDFMLYLTRLVRTSLLIYFSDWFYRYQRQDPLESMAQIYSELSTHLVYPTTIHVVTSTSQNSSPG